MNYKWKFGIEEPGRTETAWWPVESGHCGQLKLVSFDPRFHDDQKRGWEKGFLRVEFYLLTFKFGPNGQLVTSPVDFQAINLI